MQSEKVTSLIRTQLNHSFISKCEANPNYSLRAYARDLKIDPTLLSRLMKGQRSISKKMLNRLIVELDIPLNKTNLFTSMNIGPMKGKRLIDGTFNPISKWYFFVILDLFLLPDFKSNAKWIAKKINLSLSETNAAIQVLSDMGHINTSTCPWTVNSQNTAWTNFTTTSREKMNYQKQLLDKAREAIDSVNFDRRENASLTLAASSKLIPEIKRRIQNFKNELREYIESQEKYDDVYQIVISYFPLTKNEK
jgi:uncharacterized protein (TIGR02147 family)